MKQTVLPRFSRFKAQETGKRKARFFKRCLQKSLGPLIQRPSSSSSSPRSELLIMTEDMEMEENPFAPHKSDRPSDQEDPIISVVAAGDRFCVPYAMELTVKRKVKGISKASYDVFDSTGNRLFLIDGGVWNIRRKRVMRDPAGLPVLTMREKVNHTQSSIFFKVSSPVLILYPTSSQAFALRQQWQICEGESSEDKFSVCTVTESHALNLKAKMNVHLAGKTKKDARDFHVTGSLASLSFKVHKGSRLIAEVMHSYTWGSFLKGKETFKVKVNPEVDYAFIVALVVIVQETEDSH